MEPIAKPLPTLPCLCSSFRRASRALTQLYEDALRPTGLRATQFTVLQALSLAGEVTQGELARLLVMDSTTLTRTLRLLSRQKWVESRPGHDRRERRLRLSPAGTRELQRATLLWEALQTKLQSAIGGHSWRELLQISTELTNRLQEISI
jgi:DNA-binding MarR family transcriptional regulator